MNKSLYYCMSNTQLRKILYACGKSQKAKNKAAAILRLRKTRKQQQQVSIGGFSIKYGMTKHNLLPDTIIPTFTKKNKGNLKQEQTTINKTLNFSNLRVVDVGSLCLQGRAPYNAYRVIRMRKNVGNEYNNGARRITRPRKRIEVSEDVPSTVSDVQPAVEGKQLSIEEQQSFEQVVEQSEVSQPQPKICEGAQSCGLNQERAVDPKPASANNFNKIIARLMIGVVGLICLLVIIRNLPTQYKLKMARILATLVAISPLLIILIIIRYCCRCCCKSEENESEYQRQICCKREEKESEYQKQTRLLAARNNFVNPNVRLENQQTDIWQRDY